MGDAAHGHRSPHADSWQRLESACDVVAEGDVLFIMEVMKMEVPHTAPVAGTVSAIYVASDQEGLDADAPAVELD
jgi:acetyl-CoA carboxylase biotin carboxyl carrier protein